MSNLPIITTEQRKEMLERASITKQKNKEEADRVYKLDWLDMPYWRQLASEAGTRLPLYTKPPTSSGLKKYCNLLGINYHKYVQDNFGCNGFTAYAKRVNTQLSQINNGVNTQYNMLAYVGWLLEHWKEQKQ